VPYRCEQYIQLVGGVVRSQQEQTSIRPEKLVPEFFDIQYDCEHKC